MKMVNFATNVAGRELEDETEPIIIVIARLKNFRILTYIVWMKEETAAVFLMFFKIGKLRNVFPCQILNNFNQYCFFCGYRPL